MSSKPFKITADDSRCASDYQVGGAHYRTENGSVAHWPYCDANDVPYLESACTKYVLRWQGGSGGPPGWCGESLRAERTGERGPRAVRSRVGAYKRASATVRSEIEQAERECQRQRFAGV